MRLVEAIWQHAAQHAADGPALSGLRERQRPGRASWSSPSRCCCCASSSSAAEGLGRAPSNAGGADLRTCTRSRALARRAHGRLRRGLACCRRDQERALAVAAAPGPGRLSPTYQSRGRSRMLDRAPHGRRSWTAHGQGDGIRQIARALRDLARGGAEGAARRGRPRCRRSSAPRRPSRTGSRSWSSSRQCKGNLVRVHEELLRAGRDAVLPGADRLLPPPRHRPRRRRARRAATTSRPARRCSTTPRRTRR